MLKQFSEKTKVLWLASSFPRFENDSASIFLKLLAQAIQQRGFDLHVLSPDHFSVSESGDNASVCDYRFRYFFPRKLQQLAYGSGILPNLKAKPWLLLLVPFFMINQFVSAWRLSHRLKPEIIHAHWVFPQGLIAALIGRQLGIPVIVTAHGGDAFSLQNMVIAKIKRWTIQNSAIWTSNTLATSQAVGDDLPDPEIIPMGIDFRRFNSAVSSDKPRDKLVLLFVGRLVAKKGVHDLISAYAQLSDSLREKTELWIIGDGIERKSLEKQAERQNAPGKIIFFGRLPNDKLPDYYAASDIFVAPSIIDSSGDTEGQGIILLEALACGTAVIATKTGGIGEIIEHEKNGLLVNPNNPADLKNAIERLLNDRKLRDSLVLEGKNCVQNYDWAVIADKFCGLYRRQLTRRPSKETTLC
ncbi:MAG: glycosyltransferase [Gammaproteobacteria bacterium]